MRYTLGAIQILTHVRLNIEIINPISAPMEYKKVNPSLSPEVSVVDFHARRLPNSLYSSCSYLFLSCYSFIIMVSYFLST